MDRHTQQGVVQFLPAEEEGDVKEGGEVGEELEGEHLDGEALLCGGEGSGFLWKKSVASVTGLKKRWQSLTSAVLFRLLCVLTICVSFLCPNTVLP